VVLTEKYSPSGEFSMVDALCGPDEKHTSIITNQHTTPAFVLGVGKQSDDLLGTSLELFTPPKK